MDQKEYLETYIFYGLQNLNTGFDASGIFYFKEADFEIILNRIKQKGIKIFGIEPWKDGKFFDVEVFDDYDTSPDNPDWYFAAFQKFKDSGESLQYAASYEIPAKLLTESEY